MIDVIQPKNIIYTGVAGTGKTYRLQQLAQAYTEMLPLADGQTLLTALVEPLSWREVICLVFLEQRKQGKTLLKVPEILQHEIFKAKADLSQNKNLTSAAWSVLMTYSNPNSVTVKQYQRASQAFFDKDESSNWFLLEDSLPLLQDLQHQLDDYHQAVKTQTQVTIERFSFVSFHQAYGYEEFVEGLRPTTINGQVSYHIEKGAFLMLCERACQDPNHRYAMLIDELNRANVARVFGELMSLIEPTKRAGQASALQVNLAYSKQPFSVPSNVDIYATMNTQDHSLAPLDMAFRRRFRFIDCSPQPDLLGVIEVDGQVIELDKLLTALNHKVSQQLGQDSQLGHSFLMEVDDLAGLASAFEQAIIPQLVQASGGNGQVLQAILGNAIVSATVPNGMGGFNGYGKPHGFVIHSEALDQVATYHALYQS
jgi:5-methylcytosine-specific restriction protein B